MGKRSVFGKQLSVEDLWILQGDGLCTDPYIPGCIDMYLMAKTVTTVRKLTVPWKAAFTSVL